MSTSRLRAVRLSVTLSALCASACVGARSVPIGAPLPPRARDCPLSFARVDPADASTRWRQVGVVCLSEAGASFTVDDAYASGALHEALGSEACALGGEMVSPLGFCGGGLNFGVYVARQK